MGGRSRIIDFSSLPYRSRLGRLARLPLRLIPSSMTLPVLQGPNRGFRWVVGAGNHGCWLGTYEARKAMLLGEMIRPGDTVYDVGANAGYYTLLASRWVGAGGEVVAFEPLPLNLERLERHVRINARRNVRVVAAAVSDAGGETRFDLGPSHYMGRVSASGSVPVRTVAIDEEVEAGRLPPPTLIKMDIEGGERRALEGARRTLARQHPTIFLATHGEEVHRDCLELLAGCGYSFQALDGRPLPVASEVLATCGG